MLAAFVSTALTAAAALSFATAVSATPATLDKRINFRSCSVAQQDQVVAGVAEAQRYADDAVRNLQTKPDTSRFRAWFGDFDTARHETVLENFRKIANSRFGSYTYDCACDSPYSFGQVRPEEFGVIGICPRFWDAPATGTNSKGGVLVHLASQFKSLAATDILFPGKDAAFNIAMRDPAKALANAANYEYFAENDAPTRD
ncbi:Peptidyl-Lys metalloendopeptidase [Mycena indigotica]|uniref:Peptidyl-Lys metalloendopeptidase n=1 Tax=Mycena indigotica TaxID=2126181 RepID=A0A8H6T885_9AGAR|nr:Peptidyl-Lys metalloendopeptidase [Mycena indigotica]KAF7311757.1 Peptidyl-Lys metalloendopeptidase [Mycena indigotica]